MHRLFVVLSLALLALGAGTHAAAAQAAGDGSVTVVSEMINHVGRLTDDGTRVPCCGTMNVTLYIEIEYAIAKRWQLSAGLPYVFAKYRGDAPVGPAGFLPYLPVDACHCTHSTFQDVGLEARYSLVSVRRVFALAPTISVGLPSHAYDRVGEAVVGFGLKQLHVGVEASERLSGVLRRVGLQEQYTYTIIPRVLDIPHNRSNVLLQGGYGLTTHVSAHGVLSWQRTHGGLRFPDDVQPFPERYPEFHRLLQDNYLQIGGGASYAWNDWDLSASYLRAARGTNSHDVHVLSVSVTRAFQAGR